MNSFSIDNFKHINLIYEEFKASFGSTCEIRIFHSNLQEGIICIEIQYQGRLVNSYQFLPKSDRSGKVGLILLYGAKLREYCEMFSRNKDALGFEVEMVVPYYQQGYIMVYIK